MGLSHRLMQNHSKCLDPKSRLSIFYGSKVMGVLNLITLAPSLCPYKEGSAALQCVEISEEPLTNQSLWNSLPGFAWRCHLIGPKTDQQCRFQFRSSQWELPLPFTLPRSTLPLLIMAEYKGRGFASANQLVSCYSQASRYLVSERS